MNQESVCKRFFIAAGEEHLCSARRHRQRVHRRSPQSLGPARASTRRPPAVGSDEGQWVALPSHRPRNPAGYQDALDEEDLWRSKSKVLRRLQAGNQVFLHSEVSSVWLNVDNFEVKVAIIMAPRVKSWRDKPYCPNTMLIWNSKAKLIFSYILFLSVLARNKFCNGSQFLSFSFTFRTPFKPYLYFSSWFLADIRTAGIPGKWQYLADCDVPSKCSSCIESLTLLRNRVCESHWDVGMLDTRHES